MTTLYLRNAAASVGPTAELSALLPNGTGQDANGGSRSQMSTTIGSSFITPQITHDADTNHDDWLLRIFTWALPVVQDIDAQDWTITLWGNESNAAANTNFEVSLYVWRSGTGVVGSIYDGHTGNGTGLFAELGTAVAARTGTLSGSAVSGVQSGDVLVLEVWQHVQHTMTVAYTSTFRYDGGTGDGDSSAVSTQDLETLPATNLVIADGSHAHSADAPALTQVHELAPAGAGHGHTGETLALTQVHTLAVDGASHAHAAENVVLTVPAIDLVIQPASHAHSSPNVTLTISDPYKVANLVATASSPTQIDLTWDDVAALAGHDYGFDIERNSSIIVTDHQTTSYNDTTCSPETEYTYRVRAVETV